MNIFEVQFQSKDGVKTEVVTAENKREASQSVGDAVRVVDRGPYLGEGPYEAVRQEILQS